MNALELVFCILLALFMVVMLSLSAGRFFTALECNEKGGYFVRNAVGFGGKCIYGGELK